MIESSEPTKIGCNSVAEQLYEQFITQQDIAWLWVNMTKAFGYKFINNYGDRDNGIWYTVLRDLTRADLAYGFWKVLFTVSEDELLKKKVWPPNVKEFRMFCERQFEDYGLVAVQKAFREMENSRWTVMPMWSHPLVCLASSLVKDDEDVSRGIIYERFKKIYSELADKFMCGKFIKFPKCKLLPSSYKNNERAQKRIHEIRKIEALVSDGVGAR